MGNSCTLKIENVAKGREVTAAFEEANTCTTLASTSKKQKHPQDRKSWPCCVAFNANSL